MKLVSFRIKHFKSIDDSDECVMASDLTLLAGKNEAGKTNILQALQKFNPDDDYKFTKADVPLDGGGEPEVTLKFQLSIEEIESLIQQLGLQDIPAKDKIAAIPIVVTKKYDNQYVFDGSKGSIVDLIKNESKNVPPVEKELNNLLKDFKQIIDTKNIPLPSLTIEFAQLPPIEELASELDAAIALLAPEDQTLLRSEFEKIKNKIAELNKARSAVDDKKETFIKQFPKFIFFDSFDKEELLPYQVSLTKAETNRAVRNYCTVVGFSVKEIIETKDVQMRIKLVNEKSAVVKGDFGEYWKQDKIELTMRSYGDDLLFAVREEGKDYDFKIEQRSKGLQWFLSFYLLLKVEAKNTQNIILVDEPGLFVHAKAQADILRVLDNLSGKNQIIFSTHSPYLIDPIRLDRIRLVIKNLQKRDNKTDVVEKGSKTYEMSSVQSLDTDTLTPIITAIGLDISRQLTFASAKNIILEGISDYNFIIGAIENLPVSEKKKTEGLHFIPCKGADSIPNIVSLLIGWGLSYKALLDNDDKGKEIRKILLEKLQVNDANILMVSGTDNYCIEDVFTKEDFNKFVLNQPPDYQKEDLNSKSIPDSKKAILSREFFNSTRAKKIHLSDQTKKNFKELLTPLLAFS